MSQMTKKQEMPQNVSEFKTTISQLLNEALYLDSEGNHRDADINLKIAHILALVEIANALRKKDDK